MLKYFFYTTKILVLLFIFLQISCSKIDTLDDPIVAKKINVTQTQVALLRTQQAQIEASYFDEYGIKKQVNFQYLSSNTAVVQINNQGQIIALGVGTVNVQVMYEGTLSPIITVNVVATGNEVAIVTITSLSNTLKPNVKTQLGVSVKTIDGSLVSNKPIVWYSSNPSVLTINNTGEINALTNGLATVYATVEGVQSNAINFIISNDRQGVFVSLGGYSATGSTVLKQENGKIILTLSADFATTFALGSFIYLANSTNGGTVKSAGLEIAEIKTNGAKTFIISDINPNVKLFDYQYVIILCKPAGVTFGAASLN